MFGYVVPVAILLGLGAAAAVGVFIAVRLRAGAPVEISFRTVLVAYFYLMALVAFLVLAIGLTTVLKAGLSDAFGRGFSYYLPDRFGPFPPEAGLRQLTPEQQEEIRQRQLRQVEQQHRDDLIQGVTEVVTGAILWPLFIWARRRFTRPGDDFTGFLARLNLVLPLALYSLIGLISLPVTIFGLVSYLTTPAGEYLGQPPGENIAVGLVFVPLGMYYLLVAVRRLAREEPGSSPLPGGAGDREGRESWKR
jgi:hypothetical protein